MAGVIFVGTSQKAQILTTINFPKLHITSPPIQPIYNGLIG